MSQLLESNNPVFWKDQNRKWQPEEQVLLTNWAWSLCHPSVGWLLLAPTMLNYWTEDLVVPCAKYYYNPPGRAPEYWVPASLYTQPLRGPNVYIPLSLVLVARIWWSLDVLQTTLVWFSRGARLPILITHSFGAWLLDQREHPVVLPIYASLNY